MFNIDKNIESGGVAVSHEEKKDVNESEQIENIFKKQDKVFEKIVNMRDEIEREDLIGLIDKIFEHSVDDGLMMSKKLNLTPKEVVHALGRPQFYIKHPGFAKRFKNEFNSKLEKIDNKEIVEGLINNYDYFEKEIEDERGEELLDLSVEVSSSDRRVGDVIEKLDDIYAEYLRARELELQEKQGSGTFSKGEILARRNLEKAKKAFDKNYLTGDVLKTVFRKLDSDFIREKAKEKFKESKVLQERYENVDRYLKFLKRERPSDVSDIAIEGLKEKGLDEDDAEKLSWQNLVSKDVVDKIVRVCDLDDEMSKKRIEKALYKPLDIAFRVENKDAKKELTKEINESLKARSINKRVVYDKEKDRYKLEVKTEEENEEGLKHERESLDYLLEKYDKVNFKGVIEVNDKLVFGVEKDGKQFIATEDGKEYGKAYDFKEAVRLTKIGNGFAYVGVKNAQFVVLTEGGVMSKKYDWVGDLIGIADKFVAIVRQGEEIFIVTEDGREYGREYDNVDFPREVAGKLVFEVKKDGEWFIATEDGREYGREYGYVGSPREVAGKIVFLAKKDGRYFIIATEDGREYGREYDDVDSPREVAGKIVFQARKDGRYFIATENGKEYGKEYDSVGDPYEVAGKIVFRAKKDGKWFIATEDGREYGREYDDVDLPREVAGKIVFRAKKDGKQFIASEDGVISKEYEEILSWSKSGNSVTVIFKNKGEYIKDTIPVGLEKREKSFGYLSEKYDEIIPFMVGDRVVFRVKKDGNNFIVDENGNEYGKEYRKVKKVVEVGGKLVFSVWKEENGGFITTEDGREFGKDYVVARDAFNFSGEVGFVGCEEHGKGHFIETESGKRYGEQFGLVIWAPRVIDGKLYFVVNDDIKGCFVVDEDGNEYGKNKGYWIDEGHNIKKIGGKIFYEIEKDGKGFIVDEDGKEYGREYDGARNLKEVAGRMVYEAHKGNDVFWVDEDGNEYGKEYDTTGGAIEIAGKLFYRVRIRSKDKEFIVDEDGNEYGKEYDTAGNPIGIDGKIFFIARKKGKYFIVDEDGNEYGTAYDSVWAPRKMNGKLFYRAEINKKTYFVYENQRISKGYDSTKIKKCFYEDGFVVVIYKEENGEYKKDVIPVGGGVPEKVSDKLDLLNIVNSPNQENVRGYLKEREEVGEEGEGFRNKIKNFVESSKTIARNFSEVIKKSPSLFLDTISGKKDKLVNVKVQQLVERMFPEAYKREKGSFGGYFGFEESGGMEGELSPSSFLERQESVAMEGSDFEKGEVFDIAELREFINSILVSRLCGGYSSGNWLSLEFPVNQDLGVSTSEKTITLPDVSDVSESVLPKTLHSKIIKERVKGIDRNGGEVDLEVEVNSMGEGFAKVPDEVKKLVYSIEVPDVSPVMDNLGKKEYEKFKKSFLRSAPEKMVEDISDLPDEAELFLSQIKDKSPKDKVIAIENFVRKIGYYDFDNGEVLSLKRDKSLEEQFYIMRQRAEELKEKGEQLGGKKFAGVCDDFANLTLAMLREAGFVSGKISGFMPDSKKVTSDRAHGTAFVVWPDKEGKTKVFSIDGTPTGATLEQQKKLEELGITSSSIEEKEKKAEKEMKKEKERAEKELKKIMDTIEGDDIEKIRKLDNGKLEDTLNTILRYEVKKSHLKVLNKVLDSFWYTPAKDIDLEEEKGRKELSKWFEDQIKSQRKEIEKEDFEDPAGTYLFEAVEGFVDKFIKAGYVESKVQAFNVLDGVIDNASESLNSVEKRAITTIVTYLRAKKMKGS